MSRELKKFQTEKCELLPMGSELKDNHLHFSINTKEKLDKVVLFRRGSKEPAGYAVIEEEKHFGNLYAFCVKHAAGYDYALMSGETYIRDE